MNIPLAPPLDLTPANDQPLVLAASITLNGAIELPGDIVIQCQLDGEVKANRVLIGLDGKVSGTVIASEVIIEGEAEDVLILADRIVLRNGSYVTGEIWHKELVLEAGHLFEGKSRRHADPRRLAAVLTEVPAELEPTDEYSDDEEAGT